VYIYSIKFNRGINHDKSGTEKQSNEFRQPAGFTDGRRQKRGICAGMGYLVLFTSTELIVKAA
jgi:hypothetical protein